MSNSLYLAQEQLLHGRYQARCKSAYVMASTGHACGRMASRGELLCGECATAVIVQAKSEVSAWVITSARMVQALASVAGMVLMYVGVRK